MRFPSSCIVRWCCIVCVATLAACASGAQSPVTPVPNSSAANASPIRTGLKVHLRIVRFGRRHVFASRKALRAHRQLHGKHASGAPYVGQLLFRGGPLQTTPAVYLIFWGFSGASDVKNDPYGMAAYLTSFMQALGGSSWLDTLTQYNVTNPPAQFAGETFDSNPPPKSSYTDKQAAQEAVSVASSAGYSANTNYIVVTPHDYTIEGFGTSFCGYHGSITTTNGPLYYTVLPYMPDAGYSCGEGSVDVPGTLDGTTIVAGHEMAETQTDPAVGEGWIDANGYEVADKCEWTGLQSTTLSGGTSYPTQPLWSNAVSDCVQSYSGASPSPSPSPSPAITPTPAATPTPPQSNLLRNANFDSGRLRPWRTCRSSGIMPEASVSTVRPHSGAYDAFAGTPERNDERNGMTSICQLVTFPAAAHLTVWLRGVSDDRRDGVYQFVRLYTADGNLAKTLYKGDANDKKWRVHTFDLSGFANGRYFIAFGVEGKAGARRHIGQYVDDVSLLP